MSNARSTLADRRKQGITETIIGAKCMATFVFSPDDYSVVLNCVVNEFFDAHLDVLLCLLGLTAALKLCVLL